MIRKPRPRETVIPSLLRFNKLQLGWGAPPLPMQGAEEEEGSPVLFPLIHPSTGLHNQVLRSVGADVPSYVFKAMAIDTPISDLVLRNAYCGTLIPFPKDHSDISTRELGEKTVPTSTTQEEEYKAVGFSSFFKKKKKNPNNFWPQLWTLASYAPHQAGQVWEARAPNPGALLQLIPVDRCCKEWAQEWSPGHSPSLHRS